MRFCIACDILYIVIEYTDQICISVQTHKHIRRLQIDDDEFSASALHKFFGFIAVRVNVCVDCLLVCALDE